MARLSERFGHFMTSAAKAPNGDDASEQVSVAKATVPSEEARICQEDRDLRRLYLQVFTNGHAGPRHSLPDSRLHKDAISWQGAELRPQAVFSTAKTSGTDSSCRSSFADSNPSRLSRESSSGSDISAALSSKSAADFHRLALSRKSSGPGDDDPRSLWTSKDGDHPPIYPRSAAGSESLAERIDRARSRCRSVRLDMESLSERCDCLSATLQGFRTRLSLHTRLPFDLSLAEVTSLMREKRSSLPPLNGKGACHLSAFDDDASSAAPFMLARHSLRRHSSSCCSGTSRRDQRRVFREHSPGHTTAVREHQTPEHQHDPKCALTAKHADQNVKDSPQITWVKKGNFYTCERKGTDGLSAVFQSYSGGPIRQKDAPDVRESRHEDTEHLLCSVLGMTPPSTDPSSASESCHCPHTPARTKGLPVAKVSTVSGDESADNNNDDDNGDPPVLVYQSLRVSGYRNNHRDDSSNHAVDISKTSRTLDIQSSEYGNKEKSDNGDDHEDNNPSTPITQSYQATSYNNNNGEFCTPLIQSFQSSDFNTPAIQALTCLDVYSGSERSKSFSYFADPQSLLSSAMIHTPPSSDCSSHESSGCKGESCGGCMDGGLVASGCEKPSSEGCLKDDCITRTCEKISSEKGSDVSFASCEDGPTELCTRETGKVCIQGEHVAGDSENIFGETCKSAHVKNCKDGFNEICSDDRHERCDGNPARVCSTEYVRSFIGEYLARREDESRESCKNESLEDCEDELYKTCQQEPQKQEEREPLKKDEDVFQKSSKDTVMIFPKDDDLEAVVLSDGLSGVRSYKSVSRRSSLEEDSEPINTPTEKLPPRADSDTRIFVETGSCIGHTKVETRKEKTSSIVHEKFGNTFCVDGQEKRKIEEKTPDVHEISGVAQAVPGEGPRVRYGVTKKRKVTGVDNSLEEDASTQAKSNRLTVSSNVNPARKRQVNALRSKAALRTRNLRRDSQTQRRSDSVVLPGASRVDTQTVLPDTFVVSPRVHHGMRLPQILVRPTLVQGSPRGAQRYCRRRRRHAFRSKHSFVPETTVFLPTPSTVATTVSHAALNADEISTDASAIRSYRNLENVSCNLNFLRLEPSPTSYPWAKNSVGPHPLVFNSEANDGYSCALNLGRFPEPYLHALEEEDDNNNTTQCRESALVTFSCRDPRQPVSTETFEYSTLPSHPVVSTYEELHGSGHDVISTQPEESTYQSGQMIKSRTISFEELKRRILNAKKKTVALPKRVSFHPSTLSGSAHEDLPEQTEKREPVYSCYLVQGRGRVPNASNDAQDSLTTKFTHLSENGHEVRSEDTYIVSKTHGGLVTNSGTKEEKSGYGTDKRVMVTAPSLLGSGREVGAGKKIAEEIAVDSPLRTNLGSPNDWRRPGVSNNVSFKHDFDAKFTSTPIVSTMNPLKICITPDNSCRQRMDSSPFLTRALAVRKESEDGPDTSDLTAVTYLSSTDSRVVSGSKHCAVQRVAVPKMEDSRVCGDFPQSELQSNLLVAFEKSLQHLQGAGRVDQGGLGSDPRKTFIVSSYHSSSGGMMPDVCTPSAPCVLTPTDEAGFVAGFSPRPTEERLLEEEAEVDFKRGAKDKETEKLHDFHPLAVGGGCSHTDRGDETGDRLNGRKTTELCGEKVEQNRDATTTNRVAAGADRVAAAEVVPEACSPPRIRPKPLLPTPAYRRAALAAVQAAPTHFFAEDFPPPFPVCPCHVLRSLHVLHARFPAPPLCGCLAQDASRASVSRPVVNQLWREWRGLQKRLYSIEGRPYNGPAAAPGPPRRGFTSQQPAGTSPHSGGGGNGISLDVNLNIPGGCDKATEEGPRNPPSSCRDGQLAKAEVMSEAGPTVRCGGKMVLASVKAPRETSMRTDQQQPQHVNHHHHLHRQPLTSREDAALLDRLGGSQEECLKVVSGKSRGLANLACPPMTSPPKETTDQGEEVDRGLLVLLTGMFVVLWSTSVAVRFNGVDCGAV